jgi:hypothetical protein
LVHIFPCSKIGRHIPELSNLSQIYECRNWETEHFNSVLEITVSFLGIHKWEPDIYIGFSPALYLQCGPSRVNKFLYALAFPPPSVWALKPASWALVHKTTYAPMIYTALCIIFWMRAYPLLGQVGGGLGP